MSYLWRFYKSARIPGVQLHTTGVLMRASEENLNQDKDQLGTQTKYPDNQGPLAAASSPTGSEKNFQTLLVSGMAMKMAMKHFCYFPIYRRYVKAYIDFPKPLIAVVNGPAVGVSVTALCLFDIIYATESATFQTHITQQGQSPSCCSSYTFPRIMGPGKASEMLLFNKKLTATQACKLGLVTEVFPDSSFQSEVWTRLKAYSKLPPNSLALSKQLVRQVEKDKLHAVNDAEVERLKECWLSNECMQANMGFFKAKAKLQP